MTGLNVALSPLRFLDRTASVFPDKLAVIDGDRRLTYAALAAHITRLAHAVRASGVEPGDRVAYLASNSAEMLAAHFAIPLAGNVLVPINTRLAAPEIQYICDHSETKLLFADGAHLQRVELHSTDLASVEEIVELPDENGDDAHLSPATMYTELLSRGSDDELPWDVEDEDSTISINYTSGTTGRPKGVMYTHRGAYLNALNQVIHNGFTADSRYMWTLPMFHCNGWCHPWAVTAVAATHVCLRAVRADAMWRAIDELAVTHFSGGTHRASTILTNASEAQSWIDPVTITTAGAPPSPATIEAVRGLGATVTHVYGLTETYGPYAICEAQPGWDELHRQELRHDSPAKASACSCSDHMRARAPTLGHSDDSSLIDVRADGSETGAIVMRGNIATKGYYLDPEQTREAFAGGWFTRRPRRPAP